MADEPRDAEEEALLKSLRDDPLRRFIGPPRRYFLTRCLLLRLLGFIYFIGFYSLACQLGPLIGHDGLLPADRLLSRLITGSGSPGAGAPGSHAVVWSGLD